MLDDPELAILTSENLDLAAKLAMRLDLALRGEKYMMANDVFFGRNDDKTGSSKGCYYRGSVSYSVTNPDTESTEPVAGEIYQYSLPDCYSEFGFYTGEIRQEYLIYDHQPVTIDNHTSRSDDEHIRFIYSNLRFGHPQIDDVNDMQTFELWNGETEIIYQRTDGTAFQSQHWVDMVYETTLGLFHRVAFEDYTEQYRTDYAAGFTRYSYEGRICSSALGGCVTVETLTPVTHLRSDPHEYTEGHLRISGRNSLLDLVIDEADPDGGALILSLDADANGAVDLSMPYSMRLLHSLLYVY